jgi:nitrile hydratase subunit beta
MGGLDAGPVDREEPEHAPWEKRIDAIRALCAKRKLMRTDELRRNTEDLGPGIYDTLSYHERRCAAIANTLLQKSLFTVDELGRKMAEVERRLTGPRKP